MDIIGYVAGVLTLLGYLPQTIKTIRTKRTKDLSLATFSIIGLSAVSWTVYGIGTDKPFLWVTNGIVALCSGTIAYMKFIES